MATEASEIFQMAQIITHSPSVLIYWSVRINLDRIRETFSLPRILDIESSFLAASFPVTQQTIGPIKCQVEGSIGLEGIYPVSVYSPEPVRHGCTGGPTSPRFSCITVGRGRIS